MNAKISMFVVCVEAIIYFLLYNLHDCTFKRSPEHLEHTRIIYSMIKIVEILNKVSVEIIIEILKIA